MYCHNPECKIALNNDLIDVNGWRKLLSLMVAEMGSDWSCYCKMQTLLRSRSITQQLWFTGLLKQLVMFREYTMGVTSLCIVGRPVCYL